MHCERCGYNLAGLPPQRAVITCPECSCRNAVHRPQERLRLFDWLTFALALAPVLLVFTLGICARSDPSVVLLMLPGLPVASVVGALLGAMERAHATVGAQRPWASRFFLTFVPLLFMNLAVSALLGVLVSVWVLP
ncbi:MAG: hypothetical protein U0637_07795 [Phycisphaerales bacterium]